MGCCGRQSAAGRDNLGVFRRACWFCKAWQILRRGKTPYGDPCVTVPGHLIRKPDPCIYSQFLLMQLNQPVTWDNPDVRILSGGVEQYTYDLTADTEYTVEITVHNSSRDKPADGTAVSIRWIEFGAGSQTRHAIADRVANVPIWPGTAIVTVPWRTPATPGHYCIEVELAHPNDGNPTNNLGWNNTQVHAAQSPVDRSIRIFNRYPRDCPPVDEGGGPYLDYRRAIYGWGALGAIGALLYAHVGHEGGMGHSYAVSVLAFYAIAAAAGLVFYRLHNERLRPRAAVARAATGGHADCHRVEVTVDSYEFDDATGKDFHPDTVFAGRTVVWPAHVDPPSFIFQPGEAFRDVTFHTDAPDDPGPPGHFNINVRQGGEPSGGVTLTITRGG